MPSQTTRVVDQEDLVSAIIYQTRIQRAQHGFSSGFDHGLLFNCLMVNKLWAKVAIQYLWNYTPPIHALTALAGSPRLQDYAHHVRVLNFLRVANDESSMLAFAEFPSLLSITIDHRNDDAEHDDRFFPARFLRPNVRAFTYYGGALSDQFLEILRVRCPDLEILYIDNDRDNISVAGLLNYLKLVPSLRSLHFGKAMHSAMSDELFLHVAQRPNLESLTFCETITKRLFDAADRSGNEIFRDLKMLVCQATHRSIINLIYRLRNLQIFDVEMQDRSINLLLALASYCPHLWLVKVVYGVGSCFSPEQLTLFATRCPNLRVLDLSARSYFHSLSKITDELILHVAECLPRIRTFNFTIASNLSIKSLIALGEYCRELRHCKLSGSFSMHRIGFDSEQLFPQLKRLELQKVTYDGTPKEWGVLVKEITDVFCHNAPRIVKLICSSDPKKDVFGNAVQAAIRERVDSSGVDSD